VASTFSCVGKRSAPWVAPIYARSKSSSIHKLAGNERPSLGKGKPHLFFFLLSGNFYNIMNKMKNKPGFRRQIDFLEKLVAGYYKQSVLCVDRGHPEATEFFTGLARKYEFQIRKLIVRGSSKN